MRIVWIAFFSFILTLTSALSQEPAKDSSGLTLITLAGKKLHIKGTQNGLQIKEYQGKILFLEFWGTHCPPCLISIPHYIELKKKYKDRLAILAIEVQDTPTSMLKEFIKKHQINYDIIDYRSGISLVNYISQRTQWRGSIPFLLIFDTKGNYVTSQVGLLPQEALDGVIDTLTKMNKGKKGSKEQNSTTPTKQKPKVM